MLKGRGRAVPPEGPRGTQKADDEGGRRVFEGPAHRGVLEARTGSPSASGWPDR
jgi:hypothetical protein